LVKTSVLSPLNRLTFDESRSLALFDRCASDRYGRARGLAFNPDAIRRRCRINRRVDVSATIHHSDDYDAGIGRYRWSKKLLKSGCACCENRVLETEY
jgi:hypothetical protein